MNQQLILAYLGNNDVDETVFCSLPGVCYTRVALHLSERCVHFVDMVRISRDVFIFSTFVLPIFIFHVHKSTCERNDFNRK